MRLYEIVQGAVMTKLTDIHPANSPLDKLFDRLCSMDITEELNIFGDAFLIKEAKREMEELRQRSPVLLTLRGKPQKVVGTMQIQSQHQHMTYTNKGRFPIVLIEDA